VRLAASRAAGAGAGAGATGAGAADQRQYLYFFVPVMQVNKVPADAPATLAGMSTRPVNTQNLKISGTKVLEKLKLVVRTTIRYQASLPAA
jgi:hypothetical protein